MAKTGKVYFGLSWIVSIILAVILVTNIVLGAVTRFKRGKILGLILNIILCPIFYIVDLVTVILYKDLVLLA